MSKLLEEHARRENAAVGGRDIVSHAAESIRATLLAEGNAMPGTVARRLGASARRLQRQLAEAETTFRAIKEAVERDRAEAPRRTGDRRSLTKVWVDRA